eukprot:TRINITY_DN5998_c0_g1_i1.p1 TRINITY_DN5998_c0_g1~~TRINITY_DN5998_c0_g1_i1.p1  ORF type:complete len:465 (+),score=104.36 TRINITY_DN5998_c0_g1_i1:168-1562(+)
MPSKGLPMFRSLSLSLNESAITGSLERVKEDFYRETASLKARMEQSQRDWEASQGEVQGLKLAAIDAQQRFADVSQSLAFAERDRDAAMAAQASLQSQISHVSQERANLEQELEKESQNNYVLSLELEALQSHSSSLQEATTSAFAKGEQEEDLSSKLRELLSEKSQELHAAAQRELAVTTQLSVVSERAEQLQGIVETQARHVSELEDKVGELSSSALSQKVAQFRDDALLSRRENTDTLTDFHALSMTAEKLLKEKSDWAEYFGKDDANFDAIAILSNEKSEIKQLLFQKTVQLEQLLRENMRLQAEIQVSTATVSQLKKQEDVIRLFASELRERLAQEASDEIPIPELPATNAADIDREIRSKIGSEMSKSLEQLQRSEVEPSSWFGKALNVFGFGEQSVPNTPSKAKQISQSEAVAHEVEAPEMPSSVSQVSAVTSVSPEMNATGHQASAAPEVSSSAAV